MKRPEIERAKERRQATKRAIRLIREAHRTRRTPVLLGTETGERAIAVAVRILDGRCRLTGEDPDEVLNELDAST
jgi:hypothetical protein